MTDKMLVLADEKILCIYPYRDSDYTRITKQTRNALIVGYGAPEITKEQLKEAVETTTLYIKQVSNGKTEMIKIFNAW